MHVEPLAVLRLVAAGLAASDRSVERNVRSGLVAGLAHQRLPLGAVWAGVGVTPGDDEMGKLVGQDFSLDVGRRVEDVRAESDFEAGRGARGEGAAEAG